jgi:glycosyltransferase involved in cell wall biosynthesis
LRNEKLARTMGQNARKLIEDRFSLKHMIGNYLGLLEAISESRSK